MGERGASCQAPPVPHMVVATENDAPSRTKVSVQGPPPPASATSRRQRPILSAAACSEGRTRRVVTYMWTVPALSLVRARAGLPGTAALPLPVWVGNSSFVTSASPPLGAIVRRPGTAEGALLRAWSHPPCRQPVPQSQRPAEAPPRRRWLLRRRPPTPA